ncbi:MAG: hypothetical protein ACRCS0_13150 [Albidovulum sp.]
MSDPLSNSEIQDVLSSIRRLVSEDRRAREAQAPEAPAGEAVVGKLILTEAHRVEIVEELPVRDVEAETAAAEEPVAQMESRDGIRPASVLDDDLASLESTIAELEAAVAGIGAEFEPDGSEVGPAANDTVSRQLEDAFDDGFIVDIGGPVRVEPAAEDMLDEPVSGSATMPAAGGEKAAEEISFLRSASGARRPDWQVISGGESVSAPGSGLTGRLHLRPATEAVDPGPLGAGDDEDFGDVTEDAVPADAVAEAAEVTQAEAPEAEVAADAAAAEEGALDIPVDPDMEVAAAMEMMADAAPPVAEATDLVEPLDAPEPALAEEEAPVAIPDDLETPLMAAAAGLAGAASDLTEEAEEDGVDLFANADEAVIDMEMLRELIVQVLREELQGPLGERITRNVRKLVRQEIARALESQKFE